MKNGILVPLLLLACLEGQAQTMPKNPNVTDNKGHRQGKWTVWLDANSVPTTIQDSARFYRLIEYKDDKPVGVTHDYYRSGKLQSEGVLMQDRPTELLDFTKSVRFFAEDGTEDFIIPLEAALYYYESIGEFKKALPFAEKAAALEKEKYGKESQIYANRINDIGLLYSDMSDHAKAEAAFIEALNITVKASGKENKDYIAVLGNLALVYINSSRFEKALPLSLEVVGLREKSNGKDAEYANAINSLGILYGDLGNYPKSSALCLEALEIRGKILGKEHPDYASSLNNLAIQYQNMGAYDKAEPLLIEALELRAKTIGKQHPRYANSLNSLAANYIAMSNETKAEPLYLESLEVLAKSPGKESPAYANVLNNLARMYMSKSFYKKAEPLFIESAGIAERTLGKEHPYYMNALSSLGNLYSVENRLAQSEKYYVQAMEIRGKVLGKEHANYATSLNDLGIVWQKKKDYKKAEQLLSEAMTIREKALGVEHPTYTLSLNNMALLYCEQGNYAKAEPYFLKVTSRSLEYISRYFTSLSEFEKDAFNKAIRGYFNTFNSFALLRYPQNPAITGVMYNNHLATKALLLNSSSKWRKRIRDSGDKDLIASFTDWEEKEARLAKWYKEAKPSMRAQIDSLEKETNAMEKTLSERSELFASRADKKSYTWQEVRDKLKGDEAAVEILRVKKLGIKGSATDSSDAQMPSYKLYGFTDTIQYVALIVTSFSTEPEMVVLKNGNNMENRLLKFYSNSISGQTPDMESYDQYWKPIEEHLRQHRKHPAGGWKVYFSAEGVYNQINLNTLLNPITKKYVLEESKITLITNTKDLVSRKDTKLSNNKSFLFGSPDFDMKAEDRKKSVSHQREKPDLFALNVERGDVLVDLPGTLMEVESIATLMNDKGWKSEVLTGKQALEENIKDCMMPKVLHIATHGYFLPDATVIQNPLLRSGLMLAGSAQSLAGKKDEDTEDGILTAFEAMNLNLDNTDLVVLSACETGKGEERNGEGVYGLQRAFMIAGARTVIMSLWKVNDETTQELMTEFYKRWLKSGNKRQAFDYAQHKLKSKYNAPYYWGAFVMLGE